MRIWLFRLGLVLWPMRSLWRAIPRPGRHQRACNGSCSLMQRWERWPGQPVGANISVSRARTIRLTLHARALR